MGNDLRRLVIVAVLRAPPLAEAPTRPRHHVPHDPGAAARPRLSAFAAAGFDVVGVRAYGFFVPDLERVGTRHSTRAIPPREPSERELPPDPPASPCHATDF